MKRPTESLPLTKGKWTPCDASFFKLYPTISAYLCDGFWEDGKSRECASLSIRMDQANVNISLSDHATQRSCFTTGRTLTECFALIEEALRDGQVVWRPWKKGK